MAYNPNIHHRKSIRLKRYDYAQAGLYFITICCQNRIHLFGYIENGEMIWNKFGKIARSEWQKTEQIRDNCRIHEFIIMPNHIHGIIEIIFKKTDSELQLDRDKDKDKDSTGELQFAPTEKIKSLDFKIWQRNYYEHIIRSENDYRRIAQYIINNPLNWDKDKFK